jgi:hypothetical protein
MKPFNSNLINAALSDHEGIASFALLNSSGDSNILKSEIPGIEQIKVKCTTLDTILMEIDMIEIFKLEAEGHEIEILKGGNTSLSKIKFIVLDAGFENNGLSTFDECTRILMSRNFSLIDFYSKRYTMIFKNNSYEK